MKPFCGDQFFEKPMPLISHVTPQTKNAKCQTNHFKGRARHFRTPGTVRRHGS